MLRVEKDCPVICFFNSDPLNNLDSSLKCNFEVGG